jgi:O-succinylbenzoic acid--CoA ligase
MPGPPPRARARASPYALAVLVEAWLERAARARPHAVAIEAAAQLSYAQLLRRARAGAEELAALGVARGERVVLALAPGPDFAIWLHAALLAGAVAVPLDLRLGATERERVMKGGRVLVDEGGARPLPAGAPARAAPHVHSRPSAGAVRAAGAGVAGAAVHDLDAPALLIQTSGTSAQPKPVTLTYGNLLWSALGSAVALGRDPEERWLCTLPVAHVGGLSILVRSAIYATTAVVHERFDVERVLTALREEGITLVSLVATTLARLLDAGLEHPPRLRCALVGGGPLPAALLERARAAGVPVSPTYGLSEACSQVATEPLAAPGGGARALFCTRLRIERPGDEILVAGPTVAPGAVAADGWLHTGDVGTLDANGVLHVSGRRAETIISGGENVAPAEVEAVIEAHPGVLEAAVVGRPDPRWGEAVCALVVPEPGAEPAVEELRAHCAERLAPFKVPKHVQLVPGPLPRTAAGKLMRRMLAAQGSPAGARGAR